MSWHCATVDNSDAAGSRRATFTYVVCSGRLAGGKMHLQLNTARCSFKTKLEALQVTGRVLSATALALLQLELRPF